MYVQKRNFWDKVSIFGTKKKNLRQIWSKLLGDRKNIFMFAGDIFKEPYYDSRVHIDRGAGKAPEREMCRDESVYDRQGLISRNAGAGMLLYRQDQICL